MAKMNRRRGCASARWAPAAAKDRPEIRSHRHRLPGGSSRPSGAFKTRTRNMSGSLMSALNYALELETHGCCWCRCCRHRPPPARPVGGAPHPGGKGRRLAPVAPPQPEGPLLPAAVHLGEGGRCRQYRHPPHGRTAPAGCHGMALDTPGIDGVVLDPWSPIPPRWTIALLNGSAARAGHGDPDAPAQKGSREKSCLPRLVG